MSFVYSELHDVSSKPHIYRARHTTDPAMSERLLEFVGATEVPTFVIAACFSQLKSENQVLYSILLRARTSSKFQVGLKAPCRSSRYSQDRDTLTLSDLILKYLNRLSKCSASGSSIRFRRTSPIFLLCLFVLHTIDVAKERGACLTSGVSCVLCRR